VSKQLKQGLPMNHDMKSKWLILFFEDQLSLGMVNGESPDSFTARGREYRNTGHGDLTTFYDRLEDRAGKLIGIRLYAVRGTEKFLRAVPISLYVVKFSENPIIDVYFSLSATEGVVSTEDQAFGGKWFIGTGGRIALSLDFTYLASGKDDWRALNEAVAEWIDIAR
jgi:hypothetical protein